MSSVPFLVPKPQLRVIWTDELGKFVSKLLNGLKRDLLQLIKTTDTIELIRRVCTLLFC